MGISVNCVCTNSTEISKILAYHRNQLLNGLNVFLASKIYRAIYFYTWLVCNGMACSAVTFLFQPPSHPSFENCYQFFADMQLYRQQLNLPSVFEGYINEKTYHLSKLNCLVTPSGAANFLWPKLQFAINRGPFQDLMEGY